MTKNERVRASFLRTVVRSTAMHSVALISLTVCPIASAFAQSTQDIMQKLESMEAEIHSLKSRLKKYEDKDTADQKIAAPVAIRSTETQNSTGAPVNTITNASQPVEIPPSGATTQPGTTKTASTATTTTSTKPVGFEWPKVESVKTLNADLDPGAFGMTYRSSDAMKFGAYGEIRYGRQETEGGWKNGFDASRVVLLGTYPITDKILFNTEIEFEHGGIASDEDDKLQGSSEIEQVFIDFKIDDYFNWRAPGVDIVPVGYVGLFHEPTQFYSVERPELYNSIIPSTWFEGSTSFYGKVMDNLTYQFQVSTGLEDSGEIGQDSDSNVPAGGYDPGISGTEALGLSRATVGDRRQLGNNVGYALRLAYTPPIVPGLAGSTSVYFTPDVKARGGYGTRTDGSTFDLGKSSLFLADTELRYRIPETGFEFRGEYVGVEFGNNKNLRANNDGDPEDNVGDSMWGYSFEGAYHVDLSPMGTNGWDLVPFYRYTQEDLQTNGYDGADANDPTGAGKQQYHTFGVALFPTPKVVLKFDYQRAIDDAPNSPKADHLLGSVGFFF